jgi:hypothetical protein
MSTTVGASAAEQGKLPEIGREPKPDDHNQMAAQQRRNNKRIIPFAHGAFTVDSDTLASAKASWTIGERVHDSIAQFGDTSRSEHAQSKKQKKGDPAAASAAAAAPIHKPSVRQVQVSTYRRFAFGTNRIQSARYTLLSFLPLNLWEQIVPWNKPANTYFICIASQSSQSAESDVIVGAFAAIRC